MLGGVGREELCVGDKAASKVKDMGFMDGGLGINVASLLRLPRFGTVPVFI